MADLAITGLVFPLPDLQNAMAPMVEGLTVGGSTPGRIRSGFLGWTCRPGMAGRLDRQAQLEASADLLASVQALRSNP